MRNNQDGNAAESYRIIRDGDVTRSYRMRTYSLIKRIS